MGMIVLPSQVKREGEEGAIIFYIFLLCPKGPNAWLNIPLSPCERNEKRGSIFYRKKKFLGEEGVLSFCYVRA